MTREARATPCGRRWPSSAGSASPCPRLTAGARSALMSRGTSSKSSGAPRILDPTGPPGWLPAVAATAVEAAGTDAQKKRWLSAIATGDARATLAFLDADMDWDPEAMATGAG